MPFVPAVLEQGLLDLIRNPPPSAQESAKRLAKAYADFVQPALGAGAPATFTGLEASVMAAQMSGSFLAKGAPPTAMAGIAAGVLAFWLSPPVLFGPAVTASWAGAPVLNGCLSTLTNTKISDSAAAKRLTRCFETATRLVFVQPPGTVPPVPLG